MGVISSIFTWWFSFLFHLALVFFEGHNLEECLGLPLHLICGLSLTFLEALKAEDDPVLYVCVCVQVDMCACAHMCACVCNETCMIAL